MRFSALAFASVLLVPAVGHAQSMDDLIRSLKPKPGGTTRGIRPVGPASAAEAAPVTYAAVARPAATPRPVAHAAPAAQAAAVAAPAAPAAADATGAGVASIEIQFQTGSDRLTPAAMHKLDELGRALASPQLSQYRFRIEGHTDAVGSADGNLALSARRALSVVDYMVSRHGIDRVRLTSVGLGQTQMTVQTADGVAESRNRRVQIVNVGT